MELLLTEDAGTKLRLDHCCRGTVQVTIKTVSGISAIDRYQLLGKKKLKNFGDVLVCVVNRLLVMLESSVICST